MLCCAVLCVVLCGAVLCCAVLCCAVLCCAVLCPQVVTTVSKRLCEVGRFEAAAELCLGIELFKEAIDVFIKVAFSPLFRFCLFPHFLLLLSARA